jgi:hypothetical protein
VLLLNGHQIIQVHPRTTIQAFDALRLQQIGSLAASDTRSTTNNDPFHLFKLFRVI